MVAEYKGAKYTAKVMNRNGYHIFLPNVGDIADLKQSPPPNPYAESSTQLYPLGTKLMQGERVWRYSKNGGTGLDIAAPLQSAIAVHAEQNDDIVVGAASAIGVNTVTLTSTENLDGAPNNEANAFAEGYLIVNDEAGEGQMYKIKENEALVTTGNSIFTLYDNLTIALTTSSQVGIMKNPYDLVIATTAVMTAGFAGIPLIAVTASYYFWSQTGGPAPVNAKQAIPIGDIVVVGTTAAQVDLMAAFTTETIIGHAMTPAIADGEYFMVFLSGDR